MLTVQDLDRNLVLQNETMDEDLEHFNDVVEDDEDQTNATEIEISQAANDNQNSDDGGTNSDSSLSEGDSAPPDSEGEDSDESNDLLMGGDQGKIKDSMSIIDDNKLQSEVTDSRSRLPGGYNLRHREPSYWYL